MSNIPTCGMSEDVCLVHFCSVHRDPVIVWSGPGGAAFGADRRCIAGISCDVGLTLTTTHHDGNQHCYHLLCWNCRKLDYQERRRHPTPWVGSSDQILLHIPCLNQNWKQAKLQPPQYQ